MQIRKKVYEILNSSCNVKQLKESKSFKIMSGYKKNIGKQTYQVSKKNVL